jgi:hypothetical protein
MTKDEKREQQHQMNEEFRKAVWLRDCNCAPITETNTWKAYCRYWKTRTAEEKVTILTNPKHKDNLWTGKFLDVAHIDSRAQKPEEKYNPDNGVVICRWAHVLIDKYLNPLTLQKITPEERIVLLTKLKNKPINSNE